MGFMPKEADTLPQLLFTKLHTLPLTVFRAAATSPIAADFPAETLDDTKRALENCTACTEIALRGNAMPGRFFWSAFSGAQCGFPFFLLPHSPYIYPAVRLHFNLLWHSQFSVIT